MAQGTYTYSLIRRLLNGRVHGRLNALNAAADASQDTNAERDLINSAVRIALTDIDFRGVTREISLIPSLADKSWEYAAPNDLRGDGIIDLRPQETDCRGWFEEYNLVSPQEFDRRKTYEKGIYTIVNRDLDRSLRIAADVEDLTQVVSTFNDTAWGTFDSDAVNDSDVKLDCSDYTEGSRSIRFQTDSLDSTDTAVGIQNDSITAFDISRFLGRGHAFVDARLTTADTGIHQISLRLGSDSNNYYQINDSNTADCSAFIAGWNKIRFNFDAKTTTGIPVDTAINFCALFWSRDTTTAALLHQLDTDWGFDQLMLKLGKQYRLSYYSRFYWQDTAPVGTTTLLENSADDCDALMVQNDELEVIMAKAAELASQFLRDNEDASYFGQQYEKLKSSYLMKNPSRAGVLTQSYYEFESLDLARRRLDRDS